jgi:hypothetical protein
MDEDIPIDTVHDVVVIQRRDGSHELAFEYIRSDGTHCAIVLWLALAPRDRGTRLLNKFRVHGIPVKIMTAPR